MQAKVHELQHARFSNHVRYIVSTVLHELRSAKRPHDSAQVRLYSSTKLWFEQRAMCLSLLLHMVRHVHGRPLQLLNCCHRMLLADSVQNTGLGLLVHVPTACQLCLFILDQRGLRQFHSMQSGQLCVCLRRTGFCERTRPGGSGRHPVASAYRHLVHRVNATRGRRAASRCSEHRAWHTWTLEVESGSSEHKCGRPCRIAHGGGRRLPGGALQQSNSMRPCV